MPERHTHSYVRHGTTSLFAALDVASGFVIGKCYKRHRAVEFLEFLKEIDAHVAEGLDVHIVMDNYATRKTPKIKAWLARRPHYHVHFTPTSASWINQVERWFAELTRKQIQRGVHTSVRQLEADIRTFIDLHNRNPKPFKWTKSADEILASVKRFCRGILLAPALRSPEIRRLCLYRRTVLALLGVACNGVASPFLLVISEGSFTAGVSMYGGNRPGLARTLPTLAREVGRSELALRARWPWPSCRRNLATSIQHRGSI